MRAYSELYIEDAMECLGEYFEYMVNDCNYDIDEVFAWFAYSDIGKSFGVGNPKYVGGMTGVELGKDVIETILGRTEYPKSSWAMDKSKEYWCGWALAQYQWEYAVSFRDLIESGITATWITSNYILHEADISKFYDAVNSYIQMAHRDDISALKRMRKYWNMTQKKLSEESGVSLRMIQLYEQGQNDITKASVSVVLSLAKALKCNPEDLCR